MAMPLGILYIVGRTPLWELLSPCVEVMRDSSDLNAEQLSLVTGKNNKPLQTRVSKAESKSEIIIQMT